MIFRTKTDTSSAKKAVVVPKYISELPLIIQLLVSD